VKRILSVLFFLALVATTTSTVYAQSACSNTTLNSNYAFTDSGFADSGLFMRHARVKGTAVPVSAVGVLSFDGAGDVSFSSLTLVVNGGISSETGSGSYTVNSDCTGSISLTNGSIAGITFNMVIAGGGTEIFGILTSPGNTQSFDAKKQ
jgi:hypothetical protein